MSKPDKANQMGKIAMLDQMVVQCETCGGWYSYFELALTIGEYLCDECASGTDPDDDDYFVV